VIDADGDRFSEVMLALSEFYKNPVSTRLAGLYYEALKDLTIEQVEAAASAAFNQLVYFPKPVELRELLNGKASDEADLAWAAFQREVSRVGYMRTPSLPEATMAAVRQVFGSWSMACSSLPAPNSERAPELMNWHKRFVAAYSDTKRREAVGALTQGEAQKALSNISAWRAKQIQGESA
jgi:hypothetical protein